MINLLKHHRYLLSILSGLLMVISFPFSGSLTPLVFISWIPLLLVESYITQKKYRSIKVFIHAYLVFLIYNIGTTWWICNASIGGGIMAFVLNSLLMAITFLLFHIVKKSLGRKIGYIAFYVFWIGFEYLHYYWELSWPWLNLGNTFSIMPFTVQWYSVTGILGGTLWILLVNYIGFRIAENMLFKNHKWKSQYVLIIQWSAILVIPVFISLIQYFSYHEKSDPIEVVVVQPNIDPYNEKFDNDHFIASLEDQLKKLCDLADSVVKPTTDMVIAPETAISRGFFEEDLPQLPFYHYLKRRKQNWGNTAFLTGASTARFFETKNSRASREMDGGGFYESYNTSLLMDEQNSYTFLHKSKLVLGVEKLPFSDWLPFLEKLSIDNGGTSGTLGIEKVPRILSTNKFTFAPLICYESIYGEFNSIQCKKGAQIIFVITNDGWWKDTPGYKQHMSFSRLRAVENRRSVARSANTGISCFINQRGDVLQKTPWWKATALNGKLNLNKEMTFYTRYGDVLGRAFVIMTGVILLFAMYKRVSKNFRKQ